MKKGLVISGGGSMGAYAGGIVDYLVNECDKDWDIYVGTSAGNLVAPVVATRDIKTLKEGFLNLNMKSIFSLNPFNKKGKIRIVRAAWRVLRGKTSIGRAGNLRKLIKTFYSEDHHKMSQESGKRVFSVTSNLTEGKIEYKCQQDYSHEDYTDWMYASAAFPIGFEIIKKDGNEYLDGGILENRPIQKAIDEGCDEIDVIILSTEGNRMGRYYSDNMIDLAGRLLSMMMNEMSRDEMIIGRLNSDKRDVKLNFYYTPFNLTDNVINFNKEEMTNWWEIGYEYARSRTPKSLVIKASGNKK